MSLDSRIELTLSGAVAHLQLNRPEKRNAIDAAMMTALVQRCQEIERDSSIAAVILSGKGKAFCAGGDIDAWSDESPEAFGRHWVRDGHAALDELARLRQPLIAALDGDALGGGLELAACADYRIAEEQVKIGQPEAGLGIIPGWSGTQRAVRRFGAQTVRRMAMFGETFSADEALSLGIVDRVVPSGCALSAAEDVAQSVQNQSHRATELTKMMINAAEGEERERVIESLAGALAAGSEELAAGLTAFREKKRLRSKKEE